MPNFAAIYLIISLSSLGMPLLNGFIGEFTILQGVFVVNKAWAAWGTLGIVLGRSVFAVALPAHDVWRGHARSQ